MDVLKGSCDWPVPSEKRLDSFGSVREKVFRQGKQKDHIGS